MKVEELKIRNFVHLEGKPFKVIGINPPYIDLLGNGDRIRMCDVDKDILQPIPITEELLLKIGFKKERMGYFQYDHYNDSISIKMSLGYTFIEYAKLCFNPEDVTETEYGSSLEFPNQLQVHILQNIWHILTGNELEIKI